MSVTHEQWSPDPDETVRTTPGPDGRLRLIDYRCTRTPAGACRFEVELESPAGARATGRAGGATCATGELRLAAEATLRALELAAPGRPRFELLGAKSLRAFDVSIVIVAVAAERFGTPTRLLGCVQTGADLNRAAVLAVLDATNRVSTIASPR